MVWAFVPNTDAVAQIQTQASTAWSTSTPGTYIAAGWDALAPLGSLGAGDSSVCGGLSTTFSVSGMSVPVHLLDSCTEPWSTYAPWVKGFLTAAVLYEGVLACIRALAIAFDYHVFSRPQEQLTLF
jgi:hypothetical protein